MNTVENNRNNCDIYIKQVKTLLYLEQVKSFCTEIGLNCNIFDYENIQRNIDEKKLEEAIEALRDILDAIARVRKTNSLLEDNNRKLCVLFNIAYSYKVLGLKNILERGEDFALIFKLKEILKSSADINILHKNIENVFKSIKEKITRELRNDEQIQNEFNIALSDIQKKMIDCIKLESNLKTEKCSIPAISFSKRLEIYPCIFIADIGSKEPDIEIEKKKSGNQVQQVLVKLNKKYVIAKWENVK